MKCDQVRIFVVDDHKIIASTLADILRLSGFDAVWFTNSEEALAAAKSDCPNLVIADIEMPRLSGIELAIQLKEMDLDCDILLMTGHPGYLDLLDQAEKLGHHFQCSKSQLAPAEAHRRDTESRLGIAQQGLCLSN